MRALRKDYEDFSDTMDGPVGADFNGGPRTALPLAVAKKNLEKRLELLTLLNSLLTNKLPVDVINRQPGISMADIAKGERGHSFLKAFDWFIDEVKKGVAS
jgi:hypothetical protein